MNSNNPKFEALKSILKEMGSILIGYSGGVDSTFLVAAAKEVLGDTVLAVTARSETYPKREYEQAQKIVEQLKVRHVTIFTKELEYPNFASNPENRCYFCKKELFSKLKEIAVSNNISHLADGSNADDVNDHRPGLQALKELGVRSPLKDAGLTKAEIRQFSQEMKLSTWNNPAYACLSSRFPYGTEINIEKLEMVEEAKNYLKDLGFAQIRIRHHDNIARIEIHPDQFEKIFKDDARQKIINKFKKIGYHYIALDIEGYRTGSMNEVLK